MWTKFQIKPEYYTNSNIHYCVYYECNTLEAIRIRKNHSRVFDHYNLVGNFSPSILNVKSYKDIEGKHHEIYHKEDFDYLINRFKFK